MTDIRDAKVSSDSLMAEMGTKTDIGHLTLHSGFHSLPTDNSSPLQQKVLPMVKEN